MSTTAANSQPVQDSTEAIGQPSQTKKGPLSSNTVPARAQATTLRRNTRPRKYAPAPAMKSVAITWTVYISRTGKR